MGRPDTTAARDFENLERSLIECRRCPRLVAWRERVAREKRAAFGHEIYWGRPVPAFGDPRARVLVVGLAPAAHGANRTGRMFTGDRSGDWLYRALHKQGFANRPASSHRGDGLRLRDVMISASVRCAPPDNRPTPAERAACRPWLEAEMRLLDRVRVFVTLGQIGYDTTWRILASWGMAPARRVRFTHLVEVSLPDGRTLLGSYHPSQQNTFTGKLTEPMFDRVWERARELIGG